MHSNMVIWIINLFIDNFVLQLGISWCKKSGLFKIAGYQFTDLYYIYRTLRGYASFFAYRTLIDEKFRGCLKLEETIQ